MKRVVLGLLVAVAVVLGASQAEAANRYVCAAGDATCGGTPAYTTLANALAAAAFGDTIFMKAGETFTAATDLPNKGACTAQTARITIRSTTPDDQLPPANQRITPSYNAKLPLLKSSDTTPAIETDTGACGYTLKFLRFEANQNGFGTVVRVGINNGTQQFVADQPSYVTIDRVVIQGDSFKGARRGIEPNGANIDILNSYIADIKTVGNDSQAIALFNGTGPILIENNYIEGAAENFLSGGANPEMYTCGTVAASPAPTTTAFTIENFRGTVDNDCDGAASAAAEPDHSISTLAVGDNICTQIGVDARECRTVQSISGNRVTVSVAMSNAPSTGHDVRWGKTPTGITFRRNFVTKPLAWQSPVLATPGSVIASQTTTAGTLAAGTYYYKVVAYATGNENQTVNSAPSVEVSATRDSTGSIKIDWAAVPNATSYRVFGRSSGGQNQYWSVNAPTVTLTDTGTTGTTLNVPTKGTFWQVKTLFEWKFGEDAIIENNIFENHWQGATAMNAIQIKLAQNQSINSTTPGRAPFVTGDDFTFRYNVIRHAAGCFTVLGNESEPFGLAIGRPRPGERALFHDNLCYDAGGQHNFSSASTASNLNQFNISNGPVDLTIRNNTIIQPQAIAFYVTGRNITGANVLRDNMFVRGTYSIKNDDGSVEGVASWTFYAGSTATNNVIAGASASAHTGNITPTTTVFQQAFVLYGGSAITDYALTSGHAYRTSGTAGGLIGADIAALNTRVAGVVEGVQAGAPTFTTTAIPDGTNGVPYNFTIATSGGTGAHTFTLASGALPTGVTLSSKGVLSGTPTQAGSFSFSVTVTDALAVSASQPYTLTIAASVVPVSITTTTLPNGDTASTYNQTLSASGGTGGYVWTISTGALPTGWSLSSSGVMSGRASVTGPFTFTLRVASAALTATRDFTVFVTSGGGSVGPLDPAPRPSMWNGQELFSFVRETCSGLEQSDRVRVNDICIDANSIMWIVTATSPVITMRSPQGVKRVVFHADDAETETPPMGGSEIGTSSRFQQKIDLRAVTECRLRVYIAASCAACGVLQAQFDNEGAFESLGNTSIEISPAATGLKDSGAWVTINPLAKTEDELLRLFYTAGDGADDVSAAQATLECR